LSKTRLPSLTKSDLRRFAVCILLAALLHGAGAVAPRLRHARQHLQAPPAASLIPITVEEPPPPAPKPPPPPPPPPPPKPSEPTPVQPPSESAPPRPLERPRATANGDRPHHAARPHAHRRADKAPETESAFGGKDGVWDAAVCLLSRHVRSAQAVDGCEPVARFRTSAFDVAPRRFTSGFPGVERRVDWFGIDYHGRFKVRANDYYTFRLISDDGALFYIDGALVLDNDGLHGPREQKLALPLTKGEHEFRMLYYQGPGGTLALELFVKTYKSAERLFGPEL
jgi:hypothetical protein